MKRMAAVLAALGISSAAAYADSPSASWEQSYDAIASGEELPSGESAYGYSMSDPYADAYSDEYAVVEEYILVPSDTVVLIPMDEEQSASDPG